MLRLVEPYDLIGLCAAVGKTVVDLSEYTGIPERELLGHSLGLHPLCARDRFAILEQLTEWSPPTRRRRIGTPDLGTLEAFRFLMREVEQEDREEKPE